MSTEGVVPPNDLGAEKAILAAVLLGGTEGQTAYDTAIESLTPERFYSEAHRQIFACCVALKEAGQPIDVVTVKSWLTRHRRMQQVGDVLAEIISDEWAASSIGSYVRRVSETAKLRAFIEKARALTIDAYRQPDDVTDFLARAEAELREVTQQGEDKSGETLGVAVKRSITDVVTTMKTPGRIIGVPTGFEGIDARMSGLRRKTVTIIAARPSMGKSALALNMAIHIARETGQYVPFFSLEMSNDEQALRAISTEARIPMGELIASAPSQFNFGKLIGYPSTVGDVPLILFDESSITPQGIGAKVRRLATQAARVGKTVGAVFVDYMQLVKSPKKTNSREAEVADVSRSLKLLAKELGLPFVVLAQLNREGEKGERPQRPKLSNLRESGSIEQDADVVIFIHREQYYNPVKGKDDVAELIIAKGRNIQKGTVKVKFEGMYTKFGTEEIDSDDTRGAA